ISIEGGDATALPATTAFRTFTKLADGTHIVNVQVVDRAGNAATSMVTFRVDTGIFSPSGPYGSSLIVGVRLAILFAAAALVLVIRRRRRGSPPKGGASSRARRGMFCEIAGIQTDCQHRGGHTLIL